MLKGKRVLITGGGRGIGAHVAAHLAQSGCKLALCSRTESEVVHVADGIRRAGGIALPLSCDIADEVSFDDALSRVVAAFGGIDVLVNNAAVPGPFAALDESVMADWAHTIAVNVLGTVRCCHAVLPHMKRQRHGKIINFSGASVGWGAFTPRQSAYVTSKFAVYGFTEALAREVAEFNIQVNVISPGPVDSRLRDALLTPAERETGPQTANELSPEPTARMVAFLASENSGALTGKIISARWDDPEELARRAEELNLSALNTLRKIDGRHYFPR
jgi:NAD(P)-dependent dehydrogenase (short-subunit alcohol dehydrogenase family)